MFKVHTLKLVKRAEKAYCHSSSFYFLSTSRYFHLTASQQTKDYYKILGVDKNATAKDIKRAYFGLAKKYHPDSNCGNREASKRFHEISEAYEVLGNKEKRQQYDTFGTASSGGSHSNYGYGPFAGASSGQSSGPHQWSFHEVNDRQAQEIFRNVMKDFSYIATKFNNNKNTSNNSKFFEEILKSGFTGVNSSNNFREFEIKFGPKGVEFVKKSKKP